MPTENANYIDELDQTNPPDATGPVGEGDDHLRLTKKVLVQSFPLISGPVNLTDADLNGLPSDIADGLATVDARTVTAAVGGGLAGGGAISTNPELSLDAASTLNVDHALVSIIPGPGLAGGGTITSDRVLQLDASNSRNVDHNAVSISAGSGLTGGGTIAASRTVNVGAGNGISVAADSVAMSGSYTGTFTATVDVRVSSDARLKRDIQPIESPMEMVRAMKGCSYNRIDMDNKLQVGVIAQELALVLPSAVELNNETGYLTVAHNQIIPVLIEALKVLEDRVSELEAG